MKKLGLILTTLVLFSLSLYLAFVQGGASLTEQRETLSHLAAPVDISPVVYTGIRADVANVFADFMNTLMSLTSGSALWAIVLLALLVELVLLYPSVRIQLKQKKIHLFHKKLVDRFNRGELAYSKTKDELHKLYAVNEKVHSRGAILVVIQVALLFVVLWGLNLLVHVPTLLQGSWNVLNFSLLSQPVNFVIPLLASLLYFFHALVKIYYKEKEDYLSPVQTWGAIAFAVVAATLIYWVANTFAVALTIYFTTLLAFATVRYIVVESKAKAWGKLAQKELLADLRNAKPHKDRFEYLSRKWNHLPVVRHLNFHLLEEAVSMSLGLLLALNFFGAFQGQENLMAQLPVAYAAPPNSIDCPVSGLETSASCGNVLDFINVMEDSNDNPNFSFPVGEVLILQAAEADPVNEPVFYFVASTEKNPLSSLLPELCCVSPDRSDPDDTMLAKKPTAEMPASNFLEVFAYRDPEGGCANDIELYMNDPEWAICSPLGSSQCQNTEECYYTGTSCRPKCAQFHNDKSGCLDAGCYYEDDEDDCSSHRYYLDSCLYQNQFVCPDSFVIQTLVNGQWQNKIEVNNDHTEDLDVAAGGIYRLRVQGNIFVNAFEHELRELTDGSLNVIENFSVNGDIIEFKVFDTASVGAVDRIDIEDEFAQDSCTAKLTVRVNAEKVQKVIPPNSPNWVGNEIHLTPSN